MGVADPRTSLYTQFSGHKGAGLGRDLRASGRACVHEKDEA